MVNLLFVGNPGSGLTSVICGLTKQSYTPNLESHILYNGLNFIDSNIKNLKKTQVLMSSASMIVLVVDCTKLNNVEDISKFWEEQFKANDVDCPIILCFNKMDLLNDSQQKQVQKLYGSQKKIKASVFELYVPVSTKCPDSMASLFRGIQSTLTDVEEFPRAPLINQHTKKLTEKFLKAVERCFRQLDHNRNHILDCRELQHFYTDVMQETLKEETFNEMFTSLKKKSVPHVQTKDMTKGLTLKGFEYVMHSYCKRCFYNICWNLVQIFEYNKNLELNDEAFPETVPLEEKQFYEFTQDGYEFLESIFSYFTENELVITNEALNRLLYVIPEDLGCDLVNTKEQFECFESKLTLNGWLSYWSKKILENPKEVVQQLAYLDLNQVSGKRRDWIEIKEKSSKNKRVVHGYVFGPNKCGKTWFCNQLRCHDCVEQKFTKNNQTYINRIDDEQKYIEDKDEYRFLMLHEVSSDEDTICETLVHELDKADFLMFLYDSSDAYGLSQLLNIISVVPSSCDLLASASVIACKRDKPGVSQHKQDGSEYNIEAELELFGMQPPLDFQVSSHITSGTHEKFFADLFSMYLHLKGTKCEKETKFQTQVLLGSVVALTLGGCYFGYRHYLNKKNSK